VELVVGLIGLAGAFIGLATAVVSRRQEVIHRQEFAASHPGEVQPAPLVRPGAMVFRSTLFGFAIGTFFGVMTLGTLLALARIERTHDEEMEPDRITARLSGYYESELPEARKRAAADLRQTREAKYHERVRLALPVPLPFSFIGTLAGLFIGMRLARLAVNAVPRPQ
jgi:hypothetical protein